MAIPVVLFLQIALAIWKEEWNVLFIFQIGFAKAEFQFKLFKIFEKKDVGRDNAEENTYRDGSRSYHESDS